MEEKETVVGIWGTVDLQIGAQPESCRLVSKQELVMKY